MNATDAATFQHGRSSTHEMILDLAAQSRGCNCQAYVDWFTYKRWQAQGYQVQRGEKGVKLTTYVPQYKYDDDGNKIPVGTYPRMTSVFCRCQIKEKGE